MAFLVDLIFTLILIPISAFILHAIAERFELKHVRMDTVFIVATAVEFLSLALQYMIKFPVYKEVITLILSMALSYWLIKYYFHDSWKVALEIFVTWFILRLFTSLLLGGIYGIISAFSG